MVLIKKDIKSLSYKIDNRNKSIAGHPKFDLLKKLYVNYFDEEVKFIKKIDKGKFNYKIKKMSDSIFLLSKVIKN